MAGISSVFLCFPGPEFCCLPAPVQLGQESLEVVRPGAVAPLPVASGSHVCDRK